MEFESDSLFDFWLEDGILHSTFKTPIHFTIDLGEQLIQKRHEVSNFQKQYWCYDFTKVLSMPKECRDHANKYGQEFLYASAAVVKSSIQAFIVNFFIKLKNPKVPFKAFTSKDEAIAWLKELKKQNEHFKE